MRTLIESNHRWMTRETEFFIQRPLEEAAIYKQRRVCVSHELEEFHSTAQINIYPMLNKRERKAPLF